MHLNALYTENIRDVSALEPFRPFIGGEQSSTLWLGA